METKKTDTTIDEFTQKVEALRQEMLGDDCGCVLLTYREIDGKSQQNSFAVSGKLQRIAECFVSFMKSEPIMANVILAASNAIVQSRMIEASIKMEQTATPEEPKKSNRKPKKVVS